MLEELQKLRERALGDLAAAASPRELEDWRIRYLSRSGELRRATSGISDVPAAERAACGKALNDIKRELAAAYEGRKASSAPAAAAKASADVTLPGARRRVGRVHPVTQTIEELISVFKGLGFTVADGPEIEDERHNFDALNIPREHPSRDSYDTFYVGEGRLLRSHTSPAQIRVMEKRKPPVRVVVPGRCYRPDAVDATHYYCFHQVEGLAVEEGVTFGDLKATLGIFASALFGAGTRTRFRPSFFPFTEPSAEMDISCPFCKGGCPVCKHSGWIEMLGCGMVNPKVLEAVGYDSERYTGWAFGMGVERVCMGRYGISDIRLFYANDLRFLEQF